MKCKGCMAVYGDRHPLDVADFKNASCALGYETVLDNTGMMMPVHKCPKPKSHKEKNRLMKEMDKK